MLAKRLGEITETDLSALIENGVKESKSIEFKRLLSIESDGSKREFLADVSSFANATGGDILFGVEAEDGIATELTGLGDFEPDKTHLRLEEIIRNGIEPRITGLQIHSVELENGRSILIIRIPNSHNHPHMVVYKGSSRFFSRNSAGKYQLDVHELRSAFLASESLSDRVRNLRIERIDSIVQGITPLQLNGKYLICMHMIPIETFASTSGFDFELVRQNWNDLRPIYSGGWSSSVNFDGFLVHSGNSGEASTGYVQLFRNGVIEAVDSQLLEPRKEQPHKIIPCQAYEENIMRALESYLKFYRQHNIAMPILLGIALLNVRGFNMSVGMRWSGSPHPIDRDHLILSETLIDNFDIDSATFLRPIFTQIWNACGWDRNLNYDQEGNWNPRY